MLYASHKSLKLGVFELEPNGKVGEVVSEEFVAGSGGSVSLGIASSLCDGADATVNVVLFSMPLNFGTGECDMGFRLDAAEHELPKIPIFLHSPVFPKLTRAVMELGLPDNGIVGLGIGRRGSSNAAKLVKSRKARGVVNPEVAGTGDTDASDGT